MPVPGLPDVPRRPRLGRSRRAIFNSRAAAPLPYRAAARVLPRCRLSGRDPGRIT
jgi:hypothetical protein